MKKRLISIAVIIVLLCSFFLCGAGASSSGTAADKARNSVVVVASGISVEGQWAEMGHGTGFFIGKSKANPQYLLTNHHVIEAYVELGSGELMTVEGVSFRANVRVYFGADDYVEGYVVHHDSVKDVALVRIAEPTGKRSPLKILVPSDDMVGDTVYTVGYPGLADNGYVDSVSSWGKSDATVNKGVISRLSVTSGTGVNSIQTDAVILSGNSGGPMVTEDGAVVGLNTFSISSEKDKLYYAVNIDEVIPMLKMYEVPYELASSGPSALVIVLIVVLVLAAAAAALVLLNKKGKLPAIPKKAAKADASELRLQCELGALSGKRFSVTNAVRIGRDPARNELVYPEGTQGISGAHCVVYMEGGKLYIKDLGSSYGTFLKGHKLQPNVPAELKMGDRFTLGSEREAFVVTGKGGK